MFQSLPGTFTGSDRLSRGRTLVEIPFQSLPGTFTGSDRSVWYREDDQRGAFQSLPGTFTGSDKQFGTRTPWNGRSFNPFQGLLPVLT